MWKSQKSKSAQGEETEDINNVNTVIFYLSTLGLTQDSPAPSTSNVTNHVNGGKSHSNNSSRKASSSGSAVRSNSNAGRTSSTASSTSKKSADTVTSKTSGGVQIIRTPSPNNGETNVANGIVVDGTVTTTVPIKEPVPITRIEKRSSLVF